jgi:hypothetical protein
VVGVVAAHKIDLAAQRIKPFREQQAVVQNWPVLPQAVLFEAFEFSVESVLKNVLQEME